MRTKLTERTIQAIKAPDPSGRQVVHWDTTQRGFGVLASGKTNSRTFIAQRDLPGGRTRRITIAAVSNMSLADAREEARGILVDLGRGIDPKAARRGAMTLRQALDGYLQANNALRPRSRALYRGNIERHLEPWLSLPLHDITADAVEQRHRDIGTSIGGATANAVMRALRVVWNYAGERDPAIGTNPVRRLRRSWFEQPPRTRVVRADELPRFFQAVLDLPNPISRDYLLLLLFTGLRRREAATLVWADLDFVERVIRIPASRVKNGRKLDLPMSSFVHGLLVARGANGREAFVFPSANSRTRHLEEPKHPLGLIAQATGISISPHDLRRTFITAAESADISPMALRALVNHAVGGSITANYVQFGIERLREPAERVCEKLKLLCGIAPATGNVTKLRK